MESINTNTMNMPDYFVIAVYFLILVALGYFFKGMNKTTKDYFTGSGAMLWWMVGATAFMNQFSAWTFSGAAGQAYNTGFQVAFMFIGNAVGYFIASMVTARRMRQLRVVTSVEGIRRRFGPVNEQVFTWTGTPVRLIQAGTWLAGLGVFMAAVFGWETWVAIVICGVIVTTMTLVGGSWAVIASDYLQMIVVMVIAITTTIVVVVKGGGIGEIITNFTIARGTDNFLMGPDYQFPALFFAWVFFTIIRQFFSTNNMLDSYRYLCAADSENAQKGSLLAGILMTIGAFIWFIPPWAAAGTYTAAELKEIYPSLNNAREAAYLVMVRDTMPAGMVGLLIAGIFACTMSSMDSALNQNTGVFIRNFYLPVINKNADDQKLFGLSKIMTAVFGVMIVMVALFLDTLKGLSLFDIVLRVSSLILLPTCIPLTLGFFIKKIPDFGAWSTLIVGAFVSMNAASWLNAILVGMGYAGYEEGKLVQQVLSGQEYRDLVTTFTTVAHLVVTMGYCLITMFFYKETGSERDKERDAVFADFEVAVVAPSEDTEKYTYQRKILGFVTMVAGGIMAMLLVIPNPMFERLVLFMAALALFSVGYLLKKSSEKAA